MCCFMFAVTLEPIPRHYRGQDPDSYSTFVQHKNQTIWSEVKQTSNIYMKGGIRESLTTIFLKAADRSSFWIPS